MKKFVGKYETVVVLLFVVSLAVIHFEKSESLDQIYPSEDVDVNSLIATVLLERCCEEGALSR